MIVIKIGGGESINVRGVVADLATLEQQCIVVHGANAFRDKLADDLNLPKQIVTSVSGYQSVLSDENALDLMMMAYSGLRNKRIVELCQQHGINAVGLSGIDGQIIKGRRNKGIRVREGEKVRIVRDFSGKPKELNRNLLQLLLDNGYTPVLTVPIVDQEGFAINSENDDIVNLIQSEFHAESIVQLIEASGFLDDKDDPESLVSRISQSELSAREEQVEGRMKRKMLALRRLFEGGASKVYISDGRVEHPIQDALSGKGTTIE